jgi:hypothetical protein
MSGMQLNAPVTMRKVAKYLTPLLWVTPRRMANPTAESSMETMTKMPRCLVLSEDHEMNRVMTVAQA